MGYLLVNTENELFFFGKDAKWDTNSEIFLILYVYHTW